MTASLALRLGQLEGERRRRVIEEISPLEARRLLYAWRFWARPEQIEPLGSWRTWVIDAGRGFGKALDVETPIPTPNGWTTMGALRVGDEVLDEQGQPCRVTFATEVQHGRECFDVLFDDGTVIVADAEHRWVTKTHAMRKAEARRIDGGARRGPRHLRPEVVTTREIAETLLHDRRERNHSVDVVAPLDLPSATLPIDPYVLGVWLGDGDSAGAVVTTADDEIPELLQAAGCEVGPGKADPRSRARRHAIGRSSEGLRRDAASGRMVANGSLHSALRALGVLKNKHVPPLYLRASAPQRRALLEGMLDTDGSCAPGGHVEFCNTRRPLAEAVFELAASLGHKPTLLEERARLRGVDCGPRFRVTFTPHIAVFRLGRKLARQHRGKGQAQRVHRRYIAAVTARPSVPVRCIEVDSPSHLYLASRAMIPTHNTRSGAEWIRERIESGAAKSIALIAATYQDLRDTMLGEGTTEPGIGFLNVWPPEQRPRWLEQKHRIEIPGCKDVQVMTWSADNPEFRGPNLDTLWCDEMCKWPNPETLWNNIQFTLRRPGTTPRVAITTTPSEEIPLLEEIEAEPDTVVTRGSTFDNAANLDPAFIAKMVKKYGGTRLGLQELFAIVQRGARMFPKAVIDANRRRPPGLFTSAAVGVDPGVSQNRGSDQTGIVGGGICGGELFVTDDRTARHSAERWGFEVLEAFFELERQTVPGGLVSIVVERNKGGDLVRANLTMLIMVIEAAPQHAELRARYGDMLQRARHSIVEVHAFDGKKTRAEPVAAAHDQGLIHLAGTFPVLEKQLAGFNPMISSMANKDAFDAFVHLAWHLLQLERDDVDHVAGFKGLEEANKMLAKASRGPLFSRAEGTGEEYEEHDEERGGRAAGGGSFGWGGKI